MRHLLVVFVVLAALYIVQALWLRFTVAEAKADYDAIQADGSKDSLGKAWHRQSFLKVLALGMVLALPFALFVDWKVGAALLLLEGAEFWLLFDRRLSQLRGKVDHYVGYTAATDRFFRKLAPQNPEKVMGAVKGFFLVLGAGALAFFLWQYLTR